MRQKNSKDHVKQGPIGNRRAGGIVPKFANDQREISGCIRQGGIFDSDLKLY